MNKTISVIIPIYNLECYIEKCINSVLKQTYEKLEIILVDDGSIDNSGIICDRFAEQDNRVIVIHKENGGVSSARYAGVCAATGEYIGFVDGDDWLDSRMYEKLYLGMKESDMVIAGYYRVYGSNRLPWRNSIPPGLYSGEESMRYIWENMLLFKDSMRAGIRASLCSQLFKTHFMKQAFEAFDRSLTYGEDILLVETYLLKCKAVYVTGELYYYYYMRDDSASHMIDDHFLIKINQWYLATKKLYEQSELNDILLYKLEKIMAFFICRAANSKMGFHKNIRIPWYEFPFCELHKEDRVVLYGAGEVGQDYYQYIVNKGKCNLVLWVDKNAKMYQERGMDVEEAGKLKEVEFDKLLIAVKSQEAADKIRAEILNELQSDCDCNRTTEEEKHYKIFLGIGGGGDWKARFFGKSPRVYFNNYLLPILHSIKT